MHIYNRLGSIVSCTRIAWRLSAQSRMQPDARHISSTLLALRLAGCLKLTTYNTKAFRERGGTWHRRCIAKRGERGRRGAVQVVIGVRRLVLLQALPTLE